MLESGNPAVFTQGVSTWKYLFVLMQGTVIASSLDAHDLIQSNYVMTSCGYYEYNWH